MLKTSLYRFVKRLSDASVRVVYGWLTAWEGVGEEVRPAGAPEVTTLPLNIDDLPADMAGYFYETVQLPKRHLVRLHDARVSWHTVVFRNLRMFRKAFPHHREEEYYIDSYLLKQWFGPHTPNRVPSDGCAALVHDQWTLQNYYHWMADALPRLLLLRQVRPNCPLVMPEPITGYARATAALLGFTNLVPVPQQCILRVPELLVPEHTAPPGYQDPALMRQLREELTAGLCPGSPLPPPHRHVYVSRNRQALRKLSNEDAVTNLLQQFGFETVYFEEMDFEEQARLMVETAVMLGVHGANLTNILFMQPHTTVIELVNTEKLTTLKNRDFENLIYYRMASNLQLKYFNVPCGPSQPGDTSNHADVVVDEERLQKVLRTVAELSRHSLTI